MPHSLPVPLTESPRRTPEEARMALLAIAKRSPHLLDVATVDMLLSNVSHVGAMLCALGSNYSTPGCDDFDLVQVLLGHLAGVYFEAGKRSAAREMVPVRSRSTVEDAITEVLKASKALHVEKLAKLPEWYPLHVATLALVAALRDPNGARWDEGECDPIRDIRTAMEMPRTFTDGSDALTLTEIKKRHEVMEGQLRQYPAWQRETPNSIVGELSEAHAHRAWLLSQVKP